MKSSRAFLLTFLAFGTGIASGQTQASSHQMSKQWEVPAVAQEPTCPKEGWCGEASIQMICMYYGCYFPQTLINKVGKPGNPDLWSNNLPIALEALGFKWNEYHTPNRTEYIRQLKSDLHDGVPVLLGINVFSNGQGGAHFCVATKCDENTLTINTTWSMSPNTFPWAKMDVKQGVTLADPFMALAIPSPEILAAHRLRLYPADPNAFFTPKAKLRIEASNLITGAKYQIRTYESIKSADENRGAGNLVGEFTAAGPDFSQVVEIDSAKPVVFVLTHLRA